MTTLTRIDAEKNIARFYRMTILPDMFGGVQLIRQWGRIGARGCQEKREYYEDAGLAAAKYNALQKQKIRRGHN